MYTLSTWILQVEWIVFLHLPKIKWLGTYFRLGPNELSHMTLFATVCQSGFLISPWLEGILLAFVYYTEYTLMCWVVYDFISAGISLRCTLVCFYFIKSNNPCIRLTYCVVMETVGCGCIQTCLMGQLWYKCSLWQLHDEIVTATKSDGNWGRSWWENKCFFFWSISHPSPSLVLDVFPSSANRAGLSIVKMKRVSSPSELPLCACVFVRNGYCGTLS